MNEDLKTTFIALTRAFYITCILIGGLLWWGNNFERSNFNRRLERLGYHQQYLEYKIKDLMIQENGNTKELKELKELKSYFKNHYHEGLKRKVVFDEK